MVVTETSNRNASLWADFDRKAKILYMKLFGNEDSCVTDTSDSSENSKGDKY